MAKVDSCKLTVFFSVLTSVAWLGLTASCFCTCKFWKCFIYISKVKSLRHKNSHLTCPYLTAWLQLSNDHTLLSFLIIEQQVCWRVNWTSVLKHVQCARVQHFKMQEFVLCSDQRWKVQQQISLDGQPGVARSSSSCDSTCHQPRVDQHFPDLCLVPKLV